MPSLLRAAPFVLALALALAILFAAGVVRFNYPSRARFPVRGIDVSHHQGGIDWTRVRRAGMTFAFIKASEGADQRDPQFQANWTAATAAGLECGAYHFFSFCGDAAAQAQNFVDAVDPLQRMLPPVVDVEFTGNCATPPAIEVIRAGLMIYRQRIAAAYGSEPIIYATGDAYRRVIAGHFPDQAIWARDVFREPSLADRAWTFWQYADRARVDGVDGFVDLNVFRGSMDELRSCATLRRCR
jgi:lysozyme